MPKRLKKKGAEAIGRVYSTDSMFVNYRLKESEIQDSSDNSPSTTTIEHDETECLQGPN